MKFTPLDLRKYALQVVKPLFFGECALLIINMIFCQNNDNYGRNLMTQTGSSRRTVMMTQT